MKKFLCKLGFHAWVYGYDIDVDAFGWFKRCRRCHDCRSGVKVMNEARSKGDYDIY